MRMPARLRAVAASLTLLLLAPATALAQESDAPRAPDDPEIELNLINLWTTQSLKRHQSYFRITHRFARDLRAGDFGSLLEDFFSLDNGAFIGLEYRFGITSHLQAGVNRTAVSKTIQFFGRSDRWRQGNALPVSISVLGSIEALNNFQDNYQPALAASVSRTLGTHVVLYATPAFVWNTQAVDFVDHGDEHELPGAEEDEHSHHEHTLFMGLGARVRFRPTAYIVGEYSPRLAGHDPGRAVWGVAIEKATRGHTFQVNFTNAAGTTPGQVARGGSDHDIYLGFNITRRF